APAETPAALSSHDAAAVLRKLRQKKPSDEQTPRAIPGSSPGAAAPVEDRNSAASADAQSPGVPAVAQQSEAKAGRKDRERRSAGTCFHRAAEVLDEGGQGALCEPSRATQERLAERERLRESDFLRRQNEAAEKLKGPQRQGAGGGT